MFYESAFVPKNTRGFLEMIKVMLVASSISEILFDMPDKLKSAEL